MRLYKNILGLALAAVSLSACNQDYTEATAYEKEYIERSFSYVGGLIDPIYSNLDSDFGNISGAMLASATDESWYSYDGNNIENFYNGNWSPANASNFSATVWNNAYSGITAANLFLDDWSNMKFEQYALNKDYEQQMYRYLMYEYEARWARAYYYYTLVRQYGNVPFKIHNTSGDVETAAQTENYGKVKNAQEILDFVTDECDAIIAGKDVTWTTGNKTYTMHITLPKDWTDLGDMALGSAQKGRATIYSVLALKAQAALYQASPLFTQDRFMTPYKQVNPNASKQALWAKAVYCNKQLIDECVAGGKALATDSLDQNWAQNFYENTNGVKEALFIRRTTASRTAEAYNFPLGYSSGQGGNCPTQDLVDAFDCTDGKSIDESTLYDPQNPYANRDPRLKAAVAMNGDKWPNDLANTSYTALQTYEGGYHSRTGGASGYAHATPTSYYLKKLLNKSQVLRSGYQTTSAHGWLTFRLGGAYLNYGEALFQYFKEAGNATAADATGNISYTDHNGKVISFTVSSTARKMASMCRTRTGVALPEIAGTTNDEFWTNYKRERQCELCFEGHRFYDVRRWMEPAEQAKFMTVHKMVITPVKDAAGNITSFTYKKEAYTRGDGKWQDKWNFFPFPQVDILKANGGLTQNPGW